MRGVRGELVAVEGTGEDQLAELLDEGVIPPEVGNLLRGGGMEAEEE